MLDDSYFAMKEQVRCMMTWLTKDGTMFQQMKNYKSDKSQYWLNLGDWVPSFENPSDELVHTFYLWRCADYTAKAAKALGNTNDYQYYSDLTQKVAQAFNKKFYDAKGKTYGDYGSNVYALKIGVPQDRLADVRNTLRDEIANKYKGHLNTGMLGTQFFFETLAANGMNDLSYGAMNKDDIQVSAMELIKAQRVTWEKWDGKDSRNHPMFGGGLTWFYRALAGVNADENEPGYKHIIIKPVLSELENVYYSNMTPYGKVVSEVKNHQSTLEMNVSIPVGSHATVYVPVKSKDSVVKEGGKDIKSVSFIKAKGVEDNYCVLEVPQGNYSFSVQ